MGNEYLSLREVQLEELEILKKVVKFMEEKNLTYYLCGGTLLGAIRHKGFIPWDDDIDIFMPRDDYDKFIEIYNNKEVGDDYELKTIENSTSNYPYAKIINKNIIIEGKSSEDQNLWIDIFPIDGFASNMQEAIKQSKRINFYGILIYLHITKIKYIIKEEKNTVKKILKTILKPISMIIPIKYCSNQMIKIAKKYSYSNSEYVGVVLWGYGIRERVKKDEVFFKSIRAKFENEEFFIPSGYEAYLKNLYGNYMQLPPEEKRETHQVLAKKN